MARRLRRCVVGALLPFLALVAAAPASAGSGGLATATTIDFVAGPGEANDITVDATGSLLVLTDAAAVPTLSATAALLGCSVVSHSIQCSSSGVSTVTIEMQDGNDSVTINSSVGTNSQVSSIVVAGGGGNDSIVNASTVPTTASYAAAASSVSVDLGAGVASADGDGGSDTLSGIANVIGSSNSDTLVGDAADNVLVGGGGQDTLMGRGGNDTLTGSGNDTASYAAAASSVSVDLGAGVASADGDGGSDTLSGIANVIGSSNSDTILARDGVAEGITCGGGADSVTADLADTVAADCEQVSLPTPPTISPTVTGTLGQAGWYTSDVAIAWTVSSVGSSISSSSGCGPSTIVADTSAAGVTLTCSATNAGGTTTASVTVKRDATNPAVVYAGNLGSYGILQTVSISCTATDPNPGSGIATSTCAAVHAPAYSFGPGSHTVSAAAVDRAGNTGHGSSTFAVTVTPGDLCTLTRQFVETSAKFQALSAGKRTAIDAIVTDACNDIGHLGATLSPRQKAVFVGAYKLVVVALTDSGWLTPAQKATLYGLVGAL